MALKDYLDVAKEAADTATMNPFTGENVMNMEDRSHQVGDQALDFLIRNPYDREMAEEFVPHSLSGIGLVAGLGAMAPKGSGAMLAETAKKLPGEMARPLASEAGAIFPKPVYHGTASPIKKFSGSPNWFTTEPNIAGEYAERAAFNKADLPDRITSELGETDELGLKAMQDILKEANVPPEAGQNIVRGKIDIDKTLDLTSAGNNPKKLWAALQENGIIPKTDILTDDLLAESPAGATGYKYLEDWGVYPDIQKAGYDSIIIPDQSPSGAPHSAYGVFDPKRIIPGYTEPEKAPMNEPYFPPGSAERQAAFKNWFGESKVVDESGNPETVYRGTIEHSETPRSKRIWFTPDPKMAEVYALNDAMGRLPEKGSNIKPLNVSLKNPKVFTAAMDWTDVGKSDDILKAQGHDGVIFDVPSGKYGYVYQPTQVKSAIGNRGTFDPNDPNITHALPLAVGAGVAGAARGAEADQSQYAEGGIVEEEDSDMPFESEAQRGFMYANHPKIAQRFEKETPEDAELPERVQHLFGGTDSVGGFDVATGDSSTVRGLPYSPPMPSLPQTPGPIQGPIFNPQAGLPAAATPPPAPTLQIAPPPDELTPYLAQQRAALEKYGPEQQMAVEREIQKRRSGAGQIAGNAMTGLADALMQGVARAGPSNFQSNLQNRIEKRESGIRNAMKEAQTGKMAQIKQEMELAQMDPTSSLSKMAQRAYGATIKAMPGGQNLTDAQIAQIPASMFSDLLSKKVDLAKALAEVQSSQYYKEAALGIQRGQAVEGARHARVEENIAKGAKQTDAAKALAGRGVVKRVADVVTNNPAIQVLENQAAGYDPDVVAYATRHGISNEAAQAVKDKRTGGQ